MDKKSDIIKNCLKQKLVSNTDVLDNLFTSSFKSSPLSCSYRKQGNNTYAKKNGDINLEETFSLYSKSIAFALPDSLDLELAYGNRSAVLQRMNKFKDSISDIDKALKIGKSEIDVKIKILCRKVECLAALGSVECKNVYCEIETLLPNIQDQSNNNVNGTATKNVKKAFEAVTNLTVQQNYKKEEEIPEHVKLLKQKGDENPSNTYDIQVDKILGKQLVAARDIAPGEIIAVEKPYVTIVKLSQFANYCGHCFVKTWTTIPCDCCNWCMFCSEECKKLAFTSYHDIECVVISCILMVKPSIDYYDQLSLRSLILGVRETGGIRNFIDNLKTNEEWRDDFEQDSIKDAVHKNGFQSIYTMKNKISNQRFFGKYLETVAIFLKLLATYTSFFEKNYKSTSNENLSADDNVLFIGIVLLKLIDKFNTFAVKFQSENSQYSRTDLEDELPSWGACVTPLTSYLTHSCNPNAKACFSSHEQKVLIYSLLPIEKNSSVQIGYQYTFFEMKKNIRCKGISKHLFINCDCEACTCYWPTLTDLYELPTTKPRFYAMNYDPLESKLFDENSALVQPIISGDAEFQFDQKTVRALIKAMDKALECLEQPSVVICELMICLSITFDKLYGSNLLC